MTIRKLWLLVLLFIAIISISINSLVLNSLTNRYFNDYVAENYELHIEEIIEYSKQVLMGDTLLISQMAMELETHLDDPITRIKLYNKDGEILVDVENDSQDMMSSMKEMMGRTYTFSDSEIDSIEIKDNNQIIGYLNITRYSAINDSIAIRQFKASLFMNSLYSIGIVLIITVLIGIFISKWMSRDLKQTASIAHTISFGGEGKTTDSKIYEIRVIQQSLDNLRNRLKLKNKSRKVLIDEMNHQARTPLTVLRTHLEGLEDNVIKMTPKEIRICEDQVENLALILSNMSQMIDSEKSHDTLTIEKFDLSTQIKQIISGLSEQFKKKKITLQLKNSQKTIVLTDKYKLSQIIYNIITNAYKYTDELGHVSVSYYKHENNIIIKINDNGVGIDKNEHTKIFEAYYQGNTHGVKQGEGLGLFFAKENIQRIKGEITLTSIIGEGTTFIITFPSNIKEEKAKKNIDI